MSLPNDLWFIILPFCNDFSQLAQVNHYIRNTILTMELTQYFNDPNPLWKELSNKDTKNYILDPNKKLKGATLNKLVEFLTGDHQLGYDFQKQILITYKVFTTPENLLSKMLQR